MIILDNGKEVYAYAHILGIGEDLQLYEGYDGKIDDPDLTNEDKLLICKEAITRWEELRDKLTKELESTD